MTRSATQGQPRETLRVRVTGVVQGVGYRAATTRQAHQLKITGWVRNDDDGSVEAVIQGEPDQIDRMLEWMRHGPPPARVADVTSETELSERRYERFDTL
ncbi:acylphosphatase [Verticiella sediminum]|uniref:acylphosphatase n=1 Tax=Verticiella sediminum TaxID=1247510 RepID=A0A556AYH7_9BURK|nr:acylphosphatase [Verticiella sediminum]TSH98004.1 acylphosphatase [Verticiella sediminum]